MMRMSALGRAALTKREGVRLKAYRDSVGVLTIGVGHTSAAGPPKVTPGLTITQAECDEIFARDLVQYENAVSKAVKVPLAQNEFDALVSFCYNIGTGGLARSTVVKLLNTGNKAGAAEAFMAWSKPPEIIGRRRTEQRQFLTPYSGVQPITPLPAPSQPSPSKPAPAPQPVPKPPTTPKQDAAAGGIFAAILVAFGGISAYAQEHAIAIIAILILLAVAVGLGIYRYRKGRWPWTSTGNQSPELSLLSLPSLEPSSAQLSGHLEALSAALQGTPSPGPSAQPQRRKRSAKPLPKTRRRAKSSRNLKRSVAKKSSPKRKSKLSG